MKGFPQQALGKKANLESPHTDTGQALTLRVKANGSAKGALTAQTAAGFGFPKEKQREKLHSAQKEYLRVLLPGNSFPTSHWQLLTRENTSSSDAVRSWDKGKNTVNPGTAGLSAPSVTLTPGFIPSGRPGDGNGGSAVERIPQSVSYSMGRKGTRTRNC